MSCHQRDLVTLPPEQSAQHPLRVGRLALLRFGLLEGTRAGSGLPLLRGCLAGRRGRVFRFLAAEQAAEQIGAGGVLLLLAVLTSSPSARQPATQPARPPRFPPRHPTNTKQRRVGKE